MSDESAELLQLDAALLVTYHGSFERRHARSAAASRQSLVYLSPLHAMHTAHACVSRIVCTASLLQFFNRTLPSLVLLLKHMAATGRTSRWLQQERAQFIPVRPRTTIERMPTVASMLP